MKIWIINNTKFGYKNNSKEWSKIMFHYFEYFFIPTLKKYAKPDDVILHMGNIFSNSESVHTDILLKTKSLFKRMSEICTMVLFKGENEKDSGEGSIIDIFLGDRIKNYHPKINFNTINLNQVATFLNSGIDPQLLKKYQGCKFFCGGLDNTQIDENIVWVGSPYQTEGTTPDKGFYVVDSETGTYKFFPNTYSPQFKTINITDIKQIETIDPEWVKKNFVSVVVDQDLVNEKKIKIDVLLSKFDFKSINYSKIEEDKAETTGETLELEDLIKERVNLSKNPALIAEFNNILKIYKEKY